MALLMQVAALLFFSKEIATIRCGTGTYREIGAVKARILPNALLIALLSGNCCRRPVRIRLRTPPFNDDVTWFPSRPKRRRGAGNVFDAGVFDSFGAVSTWAMRILGFAGIRFLGYRGSRKAVAA
jgi:hypothetical protein